LIRSAVAMTFAPGCLKTTRKTPRLPVAQAAFRVSSGAATARLMRTFYRRLAETGAAEAALALAQRELIGAARFSHPYYWAAFAVYRGN